MSTSSGSSGGGYKGAPWEQSFWEQAAQNLKADLYKQFAVQQAQSNASAGYWANAYEGGFITSGSSMTSLAGAKEVRYVGGSMHGRTRMVQRDHLVQYHLVPVYDPPEEGVGWNTVASTHAVTTREEEYELCKHKGEYLYILKELFRGPRPSVGLYRSGQTDEWHFVVITEKGALVGFSITDQMFHCLQQGVDQDKFLDELKQVKMDPYVDRIMDLVASGGQQQYAKAYDPKQDETIPEDWELDEEEKGEPVPIPSL
jgi:hypothetical protein